MHHYKNDGEERKKPPTKYFVCIKRTKVAKYCNDDVAPPTLDPLELLVICAKSVHDICTCEYDESSEMCLLYVCIGMRRSG